MEVNKPFFILLSKLEIDVPYRTPIHSRPSLKQPKTRFKPQSKYPVLLYETFSGMGFLFLGRLGSRANTEKKGSGPIMSNFLGWFFRVLGGKIFF